MVYLDWQEDSGKNRMRVDSDGMLGSRRRGRWKPDVDQSRVQRDGRGRGEG